MGLTPGRSDAGTTQLTTQDILARPSSLIVEQQSLEKVIETFAEVIRQTYGDFAIRIVGKDLQLAGHHPKPANPRPESGRSAHPPDPDRGDVKRKP